MIRYNLAANSDGLSCIFYLKDSRVQIETMLTSPYVADHKMQVSKWSEVLGQAEEIVDLWVMCQKKVR